MLHDLTWLSQEARHIHQLLESLFYVLATTFLLLGIFIEYFKWPLGGTPSFGTLVGRVLIAAILLSTYPYVANLLGNVTEAVAAQLGDVTRFDLIRAKLGDKFHLMSFSWVNIKEDIVIVLCYVIFVLFHFSIYLCNAFLVYAWVLLYIFSPVLIALFIFPQTAAATGAMYRSLIEVSCWKIVWSVLATLFWSLAVSDIAKTDISFLSILCLTLMMAVSLLLTPMIVHALAGSGITSMSSVITGLSLATGVKMLKHTAHGGKTAYNAGHTAATSQASEKYFPRVHSAASRMPRFHMPKRTPVFDPVPPPDNNHYSDFHDIYLGGHTYWKNGKQIPQEEYERRKKK